MGIPAPRPACQGCGAGQRLRRGGTAGAGGRYWRHERAPRQARVRPSSRRVLPGGGQADPLPHPGPRAHPQTAARRGRPDHADLGPDDLLDDINTDVMTPAWVCFRHRPEDLARDAYAGLVSMEERVVETDALIRGNFDVIVAGLRKGVGSSRETAAQAEKWAGIRLSVAASFAPIHARNLINQGVLMGTYDMVRRLQQGEPHPARGVPRGARPDHARDHPGRRPLRLRQGRPRGRGAGAAAGHDRAPHDDGREDHRLAPRGGRLALRQARRRGRRPRGRRLQPRVHDGAGPRLPAGGVRRGLRDPGPEQVRGLRRPPDLRGRCGADAALRRPDPDAARHAAGVPAAHGRARLQRQGTGRARASATRWPASTSSTRATSSRRPTATPAWAAATTRWPTAWARPSTRH